MADFLTQIIRRSTVPTVAVRPRLPSRFEPMPEPFMGAAAVIPGGQAVIAHRADPDPESGSHGMESDDSGFAVEGAPRAPRATWWPLSRPWSHAALDRRPVEMRGDQGGPDTEQPHAERRQPDFVSRVLQLRDPEPPAHSPDFGADHAPAAGGEHAALATRADAGRLPAPASSQRQPAPPSEPGADHGYQTKALAPAAAKSDTTMTPESPLPASTLIAQSGMPLPGPIVPAYIARASRQVTPASPDANAHLQAGSWLDPAPDAVGANSARRMAQADHNTGAGAANDPSPRPAGPTRGALDASMPTRPGTRDAQDAAPVTGAVLPATQPPLPQDSARAAPEHGGHDLSGPPRPAQRRIRDPLALRPLLPVTPARGRESPQPEQTTIQITIGRIEVRAVTPPAVPAKPKATPKVMTLDEYLRRKAEGRP